MNIRKQLIIWLFDNSQKVYTALFKKHEAWNISTQELLTYPENTFGKQLGLFLHKNGFELIPKVERHDAYHTLTGFGTNVEDEIALQCLCLGNGKRSPYLYGAVILGILILPDYLKYYKQAYKIGKQANAFHQFNYKFILHSDFQTFKSIIFNPELRQQLQDLQQQTQYLFI